MARSIGDDGGGGHGFLGRDPAGVVTAMITPGPCPHSSSRSQRAAGLLSRQEGLCRPSAQLFSCCPASASAALSSFAPRPSTWATDFFTAPASDASAVRALLRS